MADLSSLMSKLQASQKIISMDARGQIDKIKEQAEKSGKLSYNMDGDEPMVNIAQPSRNVNEIRNVEVTPQIQKNSKLPKEIIESFKKQPAHNGQFSDEGASVLDQLNSLTNGKLYESMSKETPRQVIKEESIIAKEAPMQVSSNIDYSMIRMIVDESIKKYSSALKKSIINESKTMLQENASLQAMKIGNKFTFIDSKGNLYEASLKFIKNINEK